MIVVVASESSAAIFDWALEYVDSTRDLLESWACGCCYGWPGWWCGWGSRRSTSWLVQNHLLTSNNWNNSRSSYEINLGAGEREGERWWAREEGREGKRWGEREIFNFNIHFSPLDYSRGVLHVLGLTLHINVARQPLQTCWHGHRHEHHIILIWTNTIHNFQNLICWLLTNCYTIDNHSISVFYPWGMWQTCRWDKCHNCYLG